MKWRHLGGFFLGVEERMHMNYTLSSVFVFERRYVEDEMLLLPELLSLLFMAIHSFICSFHQSERTVRVV